MELAETASRPGFTPRGLAFATALSIGFHLLLVWYLSHWYQTGWGNLAPFPQQRPLHVTVTVPRSQETKRQPAPLIEPKTERNQAKKPPPQKDPINEVEAVATPPYAPQPIAGAIKERTVTTAQIKQSAAKVVRELTKEDRGLFKQKLDSVSATLDRALNKPRETPGVYSQADGTTRVVTEKGFTYCVKALDDWRIIDPEDDMRVSMYCN